MIEITASDITFSAYRADPEGAPKGAVVILQDVYGVTADIRAIADGYAAAGYVAVAPALFDKVRPGVELDAAGAEEGRALTSELGSDWPLEAIAATVEAVRPAGKVALVGYSWGGLLAYIAGNRVGGLACAVGYHAEGLSATASEKRRIPTLIHFAEEHAAVSEEERIQFRARRPDVSAFSYPGAGAGFAFPGSPAFDAQVAETARDRTLGWMAQYVVGAPPAQMKNAGAYAQAKTEKKGKKKPEGDDMGPPLN